eukprot:scaffold38393_cov79-Phaeocystis_antarctica.AAC.1
MRSRLGHFSPRLAVGEQIVRDAVAEPVPLRRDVAGAGKLERSTGRGHIRAASAETARWQWPRRIAEPPGAIRSASGSHTLKARLGPRSC